MAIKAWLRSLPVILAGPLMVWSTLALIAWISTGEIAAFSAYAVVALYPMGVSLAAHASGYALFGIPLFLLGYSRCGNLVWSPAIALLTGAGLGGLVLVAGLQPALGMPYDMTLIMLCIGSSYGIWTAAWARRFRPVPATSLRPLPPRGHWLRLFGH